MSISQQEGKYSSLGSALLADWCADHGVKQSQIARLLQTSRQTVHNWKRGLGRPCFWRRAVIQALCDIPTYEWMNETEQSQLAVAAHAATHLANEYLDDDENDTRKLARRRTARISRRCR